MKNKTLISFKQPLFALALLFSSNSFASTELIGGDMEFKGVVVAHGCTIVAGDENKVVDFRQISAKDLYTFKKSKPVAFSISLENCSQDVYKSVTITLGGTEHPSMSDHLAVTGTQGEDPKSIGIVFLDQYQNKVKLNKPVSTQSLKNDRIQFNFTTYVEASDDAIKNQTLLTGPFQGQATYTLNYQ
ncbi:fimbrial protein [Proteus myxofaciens]|uniref:PmfF family putative minor fimbrial subunit n=1 Tax=Proteus myxofaciens ATCC 19692 TaxID=1354337 RepID=A0A198GEG4_9GAMM|nr:fimbrial protein [Proteus myxofaciens]OAT35189.1 PmfF family putative minor fimbrial subunit [Proteus myxofaciens ATCC 19692]